MKKIPKEDQLALREERSKIEQITDQLHIMTVKTPKERADVEAAMKAAHGKIKELSAKKEDFMVSIREHKSKVDKLFNPSISAWVALKSEANKCLARSLEAQIKENERVIERVSAGESAAAKEIKPVHVESKNAGYGEKWVAELIDMDKVPREFLSVDWSAIRIYLKKHGNDKPIPGFEIKQKITVRVK